MHRFSKHVFAVLMGTAILSSCSRPVAYVQPTAREHFAVTPAATIGRTTIEAPVSEAIPAPAEQGRQTTMALDKMDALVRSDNKLVANKTIQKRLNRVHALLAATSAKAALTPTAASAPKKMNLVERLMLKKMNKKISKQLAPANPDKAMVNSGTLATGAVLVIVGLLLILLTTGTAFTVGVIALIVGAVVLLLGLL